MKYFCATGLIGGVRKRIAFLRTPQGSSAAPTLWGRVAALLMRLGVGLHNLALGDYQWCFTSRDLESEEDEGWEKVRTLQHLGAFGSPLTPHIILHYYSSNLTYIASVFVTRTKIYNVSTDC
jgi:hypothetical protein